jgi:hypothetical protein
MNIIMSEFAQRVVTHNVDGVRMHAHHTLVRNFIPWIRVYPDAHTHVCISHRLQMLGELAATFWCLQRFAGRSTARWLSGIARKHWWRPIAHDLLLTRSELTHVWWSPQSSYAIPYTLYDVAHVGWYACRHTLHQHETYCQ